MMIIGAQVHAYARGIRIRLATACRWSPSDLE
jgi:hypothetical protein